MNYFIFEKILFSYGRIKNIIFFSSLKQKIKYYIYRVKYRSEKDIIGNTLRIIKSHSKIIGITVHDIYQFEHIKSFVDEVGKNNKSSNKVFLIGNTTRKTAQNDYFIKYFEKINLLYWDNIIPHPWTKYFPINIILDVTVNNHGIDSNAPRVMYAHGMAGICFSKNHEDIKYIAKHSALFMVGLLHKKSLEYAARKYKINLPKLYEIGYLRGDRLLTAQKNFNKILFVEKYKLQNKPIVTYAPTWGFFSSLSAWLEPVVDVASKLDVNLILRFHPFSLDGRDGVLDKNRLEVLTKNNERVRFVNESNIDELMLATDVLITDVSGLGLEFLSLGKPVSFLPAPLYFKLYGENRPEKWVLPEKTIQTKQDLNNSLTKQILSKDNEYDVNNLSYNRGNSLDFMVNAISDLTN